MNLDYYLKPIVRTLPSYIRDTGDFLQTILHRNIHIPANAILVSMDVQSLYTNIPQNEGMQAFLSAQNNVYGTNLPLPLRYLEQMFIYVLKHSYFQFEKQFYLQIHGTAMGTTFAPNHSNIYLGNLTSYIQTRKSIFWILQYFSTKRVN